MMLCWKITITSSEHFRSEGSGPRTSEPVLKHAAEEMEANRESVVAENKKLQVRVFALRRRLMTLLTGQMIEVVDNYHWTSQWCESTLLRRFAQRGLRAVSEVSTQIWAFEKFAFEESSSQWTTLHAKHSSIVLLSLSFLKMHSLSSKRQVSCVPLGLRKFFL